MKRRGDDELWSLMKHNMARLHERDMLVKHTWPANKIPIEIFNEIIQYLPFSGAKNMRQVCREFSRKTTPNVFHTFAAKFHPRLCGSEHDSDPLLDWDSARGLFARHGHHINRFTMSLEYNEKDLMFPPFKSIDDYITTFWRSRDWTEPLYSRERKYHKHVQELIEAADTHESISVTLDSMPNLSEVAINLDPGWAFPLAHERYLVAAKVLPHHPGRGIGLPTGRHRPRTMHTPYPGQLESPTSPARRTQHTGGDFTFRQRELVMEMFEATEALARSWVHSLTHVSSSGGLLHLTCLRLSKIPANLLSVFANADVWDSIPGLDEVHLGVLPDWKEFTRSGKSGPIHEDRARSGAAIRAAFAILRVISVTKNITTLHFEWICGGELAWGSQRGRSILPAPSTSEIVLLTDPDTLARWPKEILSLPYITKLSLKNCWSPPHMFLHAIRNMAACSLVELKLESVSLSGPLTNEAQHGRRRLEFGLLEYQVILLNDAPYDYSRPPEGYISPWLGVGLEEEQPPDYLITWPGLPGPPPPNPAALQEVHEEPLPGAVGADEEQRRQHVTTWPEVIKQLVPGHVGATEPSDPSSGADDSDTGSTLARMEFKSCGYVAVDTRKIDSSRIVEDWLALTYYYRWTRADIYVVTNPVARPALGRFDSDGNGRFRYMNHMRLPPSDIPGWIVPSIPEGEWEILEKVYGMRLGWEGVYDEQTISLARTLNPSLPGEGRFTGVVLSRPEAGRRDGVF